MKNMMRNKLLLLSLLLSSLAAPPAFAAQPRFVIIAHVSTYPLVTKGFTDDGKPRATCATTTAPPSSSSLIPTGSNSANLQLVASHAGGVEMMLENDAQETEVTHAHDAVDDKIKIATKGRITADPSCSAEVGGHTDNVGKRVYNMTLSAARADAGKAWLVAHGVAATRMTTHGYVDTVPLLPNTTDENRAKNRRVQLNTDACKE